MTIAYCKQIHGRICLEEFMPGGHGSTCRDVNSEACKQMESTQGKS